MLLFIGIFCYLMGSLSFTILVSYWLGFSNTMVNESEHPSARTILRLGHRKLAILVLIGDSLKAIVPLWIAKTRGFNEAQIAWLAVSACLGHMFPIFFHLRGGKGIATALGGLLIVSWPIGCIAASIWMGVFILFQYAALASLASITSILISTSLFTAPNTHMPIAFMSGILLARHSNNWTQFWKGTEKTFKVQDHL